MHAADIKLAFVRRLTWAAVSQFEGRTVDDRPLYVRLRHGQLSASVGEPGGDLESAIAGAEVYRSLFGHRHEFDITWAQVESVTGMKCIGPVEDGWA